MSTLFLRNLHEHQELISSLDTLDGCVTRACELIADSLRQGGKILLCGNGGSATDSQHIAAEFTGRFIYDRDPIAAIALTSDCSVLTCIGNDYSFDDVYSRQVNALGRSGDCLLAITTSGNSKNVLRAIMVAHNLGMTTIGLLGRNGGEATSLCSHSIIVPSNTTARIQEAHILIGHTICGYVEQALGLVPSDEVQA